MRCTMLIGLLVLCGCNGTKSTTAAVDLSTRKIQILATTGMIADAARAVGGDRTLVTALMGPGVDPHQYRATPGDRKRMQSADLVLYNGLHLEGKMAEVLAHRDGPGKSLAVTHRLEASGQLRPAAEGYEGTHDPHVWFDVTLWMQAVDSIRDVLIELDPKSTAGYTERATAYRQELSKLHDEVKQKAQSLPEAGRVLITAHDAFFYFGKAYGFEVYGLQGVSTASELQPADIQRLAKLIGERKVKAIFGETSVPDKNLEAVVAAAEKDFGHRVKFIPGQLYSDALGDPGTPAETYIGMVRHNIDTIVAALK